MVVVLYMLHYETDEIVNSSQILLTNLAPVETQRSHHQPVGDPPTPARPDMSTSNSLQHPVAGVAPHFYHPVGAC